MSRRRLGFRSVRCPEQLETRAMLAGNGFMPFAFGGHHLGGGGQQSATQFVSSAIAGQSVAREQGGESACHRSAGNETSFTATLTDSAGTATGTATYSTQTVDGEVETFSVSVVGATADTTFDVTVGDIVVGQLTTDTDGAGALVLSSNPTGTDQELPADFPTDIGADTAISVSTLSGTLVADNTDSGDGEDVGHHGGCHGDSSIDTSLEASLVDSDTASTATGTATYQVDSENGETTFSVSVTGAMASSTLDVAVDDTFVGQILTDENGAGLLVLSSNPSGTEQALPSDFPTNISAGSTVTAGTLTGTLALNNTTTSVVQLGGLHWGRRR